MSKLRKKLSKWFLDVAKKLDNEEVKKESVNLNLIKYNRNYIDIIRGQYCLSNREKMLVNNLSGFDFEKEIYYRLANGITDEIMKNYSEQIKVEHRVDLDADVYSLEIYVCKPQKEKESL